jgi:Fur family transcriptional regulator, ferric uptake regulator
VLQLGLTRPTIGGHHAGVGVSHQATLDKPALDRAIELFRGVVRANALNHSKGREDIVRLVLTRGGHFSANDIHSLLKEHGLSNANLASVYRTLHMMVNAGLLGPTLLTKGDGQLYERTFERERHDHMICMACGEVIEFTSEALNALRSDIAAQHQFDIQDYFHELRGRCAECQRKRALSHGFSR